MSNDHGRPPVNTSESNKLQGCTTSTVELLGLQSVIRKMKKRPKNYGDMAIAEEINSTILKESDDKISHMAINRWWRKNKDDKDAEGDMVNIYGSHLESLNSLTKQLEIIESYLDELNSNVSNVNDVIRVAKDTKELMLTYEKLSMRKQALLGTIGDIQAKVYSYVNMTTIIDMVLNKVMAKDHGLYLEITQDIQSDPLLAEAYRKIKPEKV